MAERFARYPGAVERTVEVAEEVGFRLRSARPRLPRQEVPPGHTPMSWLRTLVWDAVPHRYPNLSDENRARIAHELDIIEAKDFPGYFLIVHEIVAFARGRGILCQGRGSAANSAVCFLLDVTAVDPIFYNLPFELGAAEQDDGHDGHNRGQARSTAGRLTTHPGPHQLQGWCRDSAGRLPAK
jgi:error-prone DNA polymerase